MHTITNFMTGYLGKTAQSSVFENPEMTLQPDPDPDRTYADMVSGMQLGIPQPAPLWTPDTPLTLQQRPGDRRLPTPKNTTLPTLWPGAGKGALIGAGGSAILDWARNKPASVRRMVIMAFLGGVGGALYSAIGGSRGIWDPRYGAKQLERFYQNTDA